MRKRAEAIDARVRPEVDEHDLPFELGERAGSASGRVYPEVDSFEVGGSGLAAWCGNGPGAARSAQLLDLRPSRRTALDPVLERRRVAGNGGGEVLVGSERDCDRRDADHDPRRLSGCARMRSHDPHPRPETLTADCDGEHWDPGSDCVCTRYEDDPECDVP